MQPAHRLPPPSMRKLNRSGSEVAAEQIQRVGLEINDAVALLLALAHGPEAYGGELLIDGVEQHRPALRIMDLPRSELLAVLTHAWFDPRYVAGDICSRGLDSRIEEREDTALERSKWASSKSEQEGATSWLRILYRKIIWAENVDAQH